MITFKTAVLFWIVAASVPLITSIAYFRASPASESLTQRIAVSLHGVVIFTLCISAALIGVTDSPRPEMGEIFHFSLIIPLALIAYSLWRFRGNKTVHLLQSINILWLAVAYLLGSMAVTGIWL